MTHHHAHLKKKDMDGEHSIHIFFFFYIRHVNQTQMQSFPTLLGKCQTVCFHQSVVRSSFPKHSSGFSPQELPSGTAAAHQFPVAKVSADPSTGIDIKSQEVLHPRALLSSLNKLIQTNVTCGGVDLECIIYS